MRTRLLTLLALAAVTAMVPGPVALGAHGRAAHDLGGSLRGLAASMLGGVLGAAGIASTIDDGPDDRLTVMLLGSDRRESGSSIPGERLDVILVASLRPNGTVAMASIPRDTVKFPRAAANGGGTSGSARVNTLYSTYRTTFCSPSGATSAARRACALGRLRLDVEKALNMDVDYYAYIGFAGFDQLVDEIDGILVDTPGQIIDKGYMDEPTLPKGIRFPFATDYELRGTTTPACLSWKAASPDCKRALVYVRSRKGTEGSHNNSDYRRSYRQHGVVMGAIEKVIVRGNVPEGGQTQGALDRLRAAVAQQITSGHFATDLPRGPVDALYLYNALKVATLGPKAVFGPSKFAIATSISTVTLKLSAVREWVDTKITSVGPMP